MPESSLKVYEMKACNAQHGTLEAEAHSEGKKKSGSEVDSGGVSSDRMSDSESKIVEDELKNISMEIDQNPNGVEGSATRDSRTEEATSNFIGDVTMTEEEAYFVTGSSYKGSWDALGMAGVGRYVMPNGAVYEGEIRDGMFHGHGSLYWPENQRLDVVHLRGELREHKYTFADGLAYRDVDWSYCRFPDRRFYESIKRGLRPGGRGLRTAKQPTKVLPSGCYDAGDGIFDPTTLCITSYDDYTKVLRIPTEEERHWIAKNCRKSWTEPTGYRTSLVENWSDEPPELPHNLAMSEDSPDSWWKRLTTYARDFVDDDKEKDVSGMDEHLELPELYMCWHCVMLGEPGQCTPVSLTSEIEWQDDLDGRSFHGEESIEYHEDNEVESGDTSLESGRISSVDGSSEYAVGETNIEGVEALSIDVREIDVSADFSLRSSGEFPEDSLSEKFVENYTELGEKSGDRVDDEQLLLAAARPEVEDLKIEDRVGQTELQIDAEENYPGMTEEPKNIGNPEDFIEDEMLQKSAIEDEERTGKSEDSMKEEKHKSAEEAGQMIERRESVVEDKKMGHKPDEIIAGNEVQRKADNENHEKEQSLEVAMEKSALHDSGDKSHEGQIGRPGDMLNASEKTVKEKAEVLAIHRETSLENYDYVAAATIPREKVPGATEPETSNELLSKATMTEDYRSKKPVENDILAGEEKIEDDNKLPSDGSDRKNVDRMTNDLGKEESIEERVTDSWEDKSSKIASELQFGEENEVILTGDTKASVKLRSKKSPVSKMSGQALQDLITEEAEVFPSKLDEESIQIMDLISDPQDSLNSLVTARKETLSTANSVVRTTVKSFTSSKAHPRSLEKVHPSLASLSPMKQKPSNEKEFIEIYKKFPRKEKPRNKCSTTNVWHLSSALRDFSSQTKAPCHSCGLQRKTNTENLRSGLALTTLRSRPVEYGRKPCGLRVRKPTAQEVLPVASPCREEYPFKIPAKPDRFTAKRSCFNIREKK